MQSESIKSVSLNGSESSDLEVILSALVTKLMQFNAGLKKIERINATTNEENGTKNTANQFVLHSILDEFNLTENKPRQTTSNSHVVHTSDYIGNGFISHILNESGGIVYILDANSMPDPMILYGENPKQLSHTPKPGEMFAYIFQEIYLVRAVRLEFECREKNGSKEQFSALLIDIGCVIRINIELNRNGIYEVTEAAKSIPSYAKICRLVHVPKHTNISDLLHTRISYKVICNDNNLMLIDIVRAAINPFECGQNEWNFYMYFKMILPPKIDQCHQNKVETKLQIDQCRQIKMEMKAEQSPPPPPPRRLTTPQPPSPPQLKSPQSRPSVNCNPFADPSQYMITTCPVAPLKDRTNPFYCVETNAHQDNKRKFLNFRLTKILNKSSDSHLESNGTREKITINDEHSLAEEKSTRDTLIRTIKTPYIDLVEDVSKKIEYKYSLVDEVDTSRMESRTSINGVSTTQKGNNVWTNENKPLKPKSRTSTAKPIEIDPDILLRDRFIAMTSEKSSIHMNERKYDMPSKPKLTQTKSIPREDIAQKMSISPTVDFQKPEKLRIGETVIIQPQYVTNVEEFYATMSNSPSHIINMVDFSDMLNDEVNTQYFEQYSAHCPPKMNDQVIAWYEGSYYRGKVIGVIDRYVFKVYFVDFGLCGKMRVKDLFKYQDVWNQYAEYCMHFRLNGVKEIKEYIDIEAMEALKQIVVCKTYATVVDIEYNSKLNRITYIVNLRDMNGLDIASTLISKGFSS